MTSNRYRHWSGLRFAKGSSVNDRVDELTKAPAKACEEGQDQKHSGVEALPLFAEELNSSSQRFGDQTATIFYTGDEAAAKQAVADLLRETNVEAIDAGLLKNARHVKPAMLFLLVQLAYSQQIEIALKLLQG